MTRQERAVELAKAGVWCCDWGLVACGYSMRYLVEIRTVLKRATR